MSALAIMPSDMSKHFKNMKEWKCLWHEFFYHLVRKSFQNNEEWHLFYCDSTVGCRVIQDFDLCKLDDKLWRQTGSSSLLPAKCWPLLHVIIASAEGGLMLSPESQRVFQNLLRITMFPSTSSRETLRFSGNKIHCSPRDQSLSVKCFYHWFDPNSSDRTLL